MPRTAFRTALITGASAGLGAEFARRARRGRDRTSSLSPGAWTGSKSSPGSSGSRTRRDGRRPFRPTCRLAEGLAAVEGRIAAEPATLDLLVNNAGFGGRRGFVKGESADHLNMVRVHVDATVRLTRAALPGMIDRGRGAVINLSSIAAFSAFSGAMYSGTKAFLVMFSQNLQDEVRRKGIVIQALCPGMTHTEFHRVAEIDKSIVPKPFWMTASKVVRISLRRLGHGVVCVPGWKNKVIAFLMRCPATAAIVRLVGRTMAVRARTGES